MELYTKRLLLRPFAPADAEDLYAYAGDRRVGPAAGWPVHRSVEESRKIIATVFSAPNTFAVVDLKSGHVIGSAGFTGRHMTQLPGPDDELGYALSPVFWGQGLIPEACAAILRYGFETLGLRTIWCNHYEGNQQSRRVIEKCGFSFQFSQREWVKLLGETRMAYFYALTRDVWRAQQEDGQ